MLLKPCKQLKRNMVMISMPEPVGKVVGMATQEGSLRILCLLVLPAGRVERSPGGVKQRKMISEAIIVASIAGASSVIGNIVISHRKSRQDEINNALREQNLTSRLDRLEQKVDIHNGYAKRFGEIEKSIVRIETKLGDIVDGSCKIKSN